MVHLVVDPQECDALPAGLGGSATARCPDRPERRIESLQAELEELRRQNVAQQQQLGAFTSSLAAATSLQRDLCARAVPEIQGVEVHAHYRPLDAVGGDAYDVYRLNDTSVAIVVIDATGHGVAASMLAAYAQQAFRRALRDAAGRTAARPSEILSAVNREIVAAELPECQCVAALVAIYDEQTRMISVARGGAPRPVLFETTVSGSTLKCDGPLLGALEDAEFGEVGQMLQPGASLILHTDGLCEALAETGRLPALDMTRSSWIRSLIRNDADAAYRTLHRLQDARPDGDDVTVVLLRARAATSELAVSA